MKAPAATTTTTIGLAEPEPGEDGFVAIDDTPGNGGTGTLTMLVLGGLGASLAVAGVVWWRRRPGRYWSA
ncbi:MAG: hypothetical protein ACRDY7_03110 [Acidimicrobiia bacterium]